jgi:type II restriction enzyme
VHDSGLVNRIDRVTASSLSRKINQNYCENIVVKAGDFDHMFQIASLYCKAAPWKAGEMAEVMLEVARTSLNIIADDIDPN